ncbi:hypothetical protein R75461_07259 [Paraburkholderia nemoris]|nr:hypothetical protein R75461_07259 [Paraburkholderia nemoris]
MMDFLRQEEAHRKMLSGLADVGGMAKIAQDFERQRKLLEGPVEAARRLGLFDLQSDIRKSISATIAVQQTYKDLFRLPDVSELRRIAHEATQKAGLARTVLGTEGRLQTAMATMRSPWLRIDGSLASAKAFSEIIAMGRGIDSLRAFDHDFAAALRPGLGDWRDMLTPAPESLIDPFWRSGFYVERGFDPDLTDFTTSAFDEGLRIAGLREQESTESVDDQQDSFARAKETFDRLQRFEVALRRFIERVMQAAFGDDWMKRQLPPKMFDTWTEKRDKAVKAGHAEHPLIDYADFTDYRAIIERKDNWNAVFKTVFGRAEDMRESFQRLFPVRIATMHARLINQDDELLLLVETKRLLRAIGTK